MRDTALSVPLSETPPRGWPGRFRGVVALLDRSGSEWERIVLRRGMITVPNVSEGAEERLRHLLDSAVAQANDGLDGETGAGSGEEDEQRARDRRMTRAFRERAGADEGATS